MTNVDEQHHGQAGRRRLRDDPDLERAAYEYLLALDEGRDTDAQAAYAEMARVGARWASAHPLMRISRKRASRQRTVTVAPRRGARTRGAGRPRAAAHRSSAASGDSGSSDDDGPASGPPPALKFWRHPHYGAVTPALLRILLREARR